MNGIVFLLCAVTCIVCVALLWRGWRRSGVRLLLWTAACFAGLAINNILLFVDVVLVPDIDLALLRGLPALAGCATLLWAMVWESR